jgi:EmrB/QacA subfamily drug resistance transporter
MSPAHLTPRAKWVALALLAVTQFVLILDAAIVNVALPSMGRDLHFAQADLSWVTNAYTLVFGGFLLLGGRLADIAGRRRLFIGGLALFTAASLAGALAQSALWLVAARAMQGLGAALVSPAALSLVMTLFSDGAERNKALGIWGAMAGSGAAAGSILGGVLTDSLGWESVLYVNVPIGLVAVALAPRLLPEARDPGAARSFDVAGAVSVTAGLALLAYALVDANDAGWGSAQTLVLGGIALGLIAAFIAIEARAQRPLVPLRVFRAGTLRGANAVAALTTLVMFPMFFFLTLYLQQVLGYDPLQAGLGQLPIALTIVLTAGPVSLIVTRLGFKVPLVAGLVTIAAGLAWLAQVSAPAGSYFTEVFGPAIVLGLGGSLAWISATIAATAGAARDEAGLASGLLNTSQQMGGALGLAILIAISTGRTDSVIGTGAQPAVALTEGFQAGLLTGSGIALVSALLATVLISSRASRAHAEAARQGSAATAPVAV